MSEVSTSNLFLDSFQQDLHKIGVSADPRLLVAYSGGLDSTVLLHLAVQLVGSSRCRAVHINHGLSEHADHWEEHCKQVSDSLDTEFCTRRITVEKGNFEGIARRKRLQIYMEVLGRKEVLVTAHHADDFMETVLWQMLTGRAQIGIPRCRPLGHGYLLRPLLDFSKEQLRARALASQLSWVEDESNADQAMVRNWIRHSLLADIRNRIPEFEKQVRTVPRIFQPTYGYQPLNLGLETRTEAEVSTWLRKAGIYPSSTAIREIVKQQSASEDARVEVRVLPELYVARHDHRLHVVRRMLPLTNRWVRAGESVTFSSGSLTWQAANGYLMTGDYRIGIRTPGSTIRSHGQTKKIAKLMQESKIPPWQRDVWPILYRNDQVAAVPNLAIADRFWEKDGSGWQPQWIPTEFASEFPTPENE